jgi:hypothetical protein
MAYPKAWFQRGRPETLRSAHRARTCPTDGRAHRRPSLARRPTGAATMQTWRTGRRQGTLRGTSPRLRPSRAHEQLRGSVELELNDVNLATIGWRLHEAVAMVLRRRGTPFLSLWP